MDDIHERVEDAVHQGPNKYRPYDKLDKWEVKYIVDLVADEIKPATRKDVVFSNIYGADVVNGPSVHDALPKGWKKIILYASPTTVLTNMVKRRDTDPRYAYDVAEYADMYHVTKTKKRTIDIIDKPSFTKVLKATSKLYFENEDHLLTFVDDFFKKIGIRDNEPHAVGLKPSLSGFDAVVKVDDRSPVEIANEIISIADGTATDFITGGDDGDTMFGIPSWLIIIIVLATVIYAIRSPCISEKIGKQFSGTASQ
jgi:hypothetical protein